MAKKSNPTNNDNSKNMKKKSKSGPEAMSMKVKAPKANPFETIWSRRKFDILGKKRKGEERRIGLARSLAIDKANNILFLQIRENYHYLHIYRPNSEGIMPWKRKKTLLKDYEQSGKSSVFVDKRIGEQSEGLGEFDKAILRYQRERQLKVSKKSKYNLSDGEEDELETGSFPEKDDFEDEVPFDDEDDEEATENGKRADILKQLSAPGTYSSLETGVAEGEENAKKAKDKEEKEEMVEQLDKDFTSLVQSKALLSLTQPNKMNALKALVNKKNILNDNNAKKHELVAPPTEGYSQQEKPDEYDKLVNAMVLDMRARPSDRTKTPEEIAQEEKERLEELEEQRQKRMMATDDSSDEDADASKDDDVYNQRLRSISGDDLGDDFSQLDEPRKKLSLIDSILKQENENDTESEEDGESSEDSESIEDDNDEEGGDGEGLDEFEKARSLKDWEQSDDDKIETDLEDEGEEVDGMVTSKVHKMGLQIKKRRTDSVDAEKTIANVKQSTQQGDLPYAIEAPKSFEEFSSLLENCSDDQIVEAIGRIRKYNAITLAAENRKKMQVFYGVLLQYFSVSANKKPLNFKLLNMLAKPLMEMSMEIPYFAAICARQRLLRTRTQFCEDIKNLGKNCWPSSKTIFLLRLWSMIFPCSDFRHAVMTPAILLMCECLMRCPIVSGRDIAIGSFLCSMVLSVSKQSRKFCPEAIMFLRTLLMAASDRKTGPCEDSELYHLMELKALRPLLCIRGCIDDEISPLDFLALIDLPEDSPYFNSDNFRASMLAAVIETLRGFVNIYEGFNSFPEIFMPISKLLLGLEEYVPDALKVKIRDIAELIEKKGYEHHTLRRPLQMRKQKPVPIKLLNPKFEENFVKGRDYDPDRERAEMRKMKKLIRREAKGAARELRKDNYFLSEVKEKEKRRQEEERTEKYGKARAFLQEQEHAFKSGQLGKGKGSKRKR
ncbi:hypothetical protein LguiB_025009 [Lonicera macranthoides]